MRPITTAVVLAILGLSLGSPLDIQQRDATPLTADMLALIAPKSKSCSGADFPEECRTDAQVVKPLTNSFTKYGVTSAAEQAALISLIALESGEFRYQNNHFPGRPGQGTRNMQMASFNIAYAKDIPELSCSVSQLVGGKDAASLSDGTLNQVRGLLTANDDFDFGSAAWFLKTNCKPEIRSALQKGTDQGYEAYLTSCVGTSVIPERTAYWTTAKKAFGLA